MELAALITAFLVAGVFGGVLLGLIGVGMALVTVPLLIFVLPAFGFAPRDVPLVALATSMAVVSVGSVSSVLSHHRKGNVDWRLVRITTPASLIGITLGTVTAAHLPAAALRVLFCAFLVFISLRMLRDRKAATEKRIQTSPWLYRATGAAIGMAASVIGAGGGVLMVPFLSSRGNPMPRAVATSTMIGLPVSILGAVVYAAQPVSLPQAMTWGYLYVPALIGLSIGSTIGAPFGARLGGRISPALLKKGFAIVLLIVAAAILMDF